MKTLFERGELLFRKRSGFCYVIGVFVLFLLYFLFQKVIFLLVYSGQLAGIGTSSGDIAAIFLYGLRHDAAVAAYLTVLPLLFAGINAIAGWGEKKIGRIQRQILKHYYTLISFFVGLIYTADLMLFGYWGFRLDATPFSIYASHRKPWPVLQHRNS